MVTQKELAQQIGITPQHLNAVLRGRVRPSLKVALRIRQATGIPVESFIPELGGEENQIVSSGPQHQL